MIEFTENKKLLSMYEMGILKGAWEALDMKNNQKELAVTYDKGSLSATSKRKIIDEFTFLRNVENDFVLKPMKMEEDDNNLYVIFPSIDTSSVCTIGEYIKEKGELSENRIRCLIDDLKNIEIRKTVRPESILVDRNTGKLEKIVLSLTELFPIQDEVTFYPPEHFTCYGNTNNNNIISIANNDSNNTNSNYNDSFNFRINDKSDKCCQSEKAEIWSCGVLLYFLMTGNYPFKDKDEILHKPLVIPDNLAPNLQQILQKMLIKNPQIRTNILKKPAPNLSDVDSIRCARRQFRPTKKVTNEMGFFSANEEEEKVEQNQKENKKESLIVRSNDGSLNCMRLSRRPPKPDGKNKTGDNDRTLETNSVCKKVGSFGSKYGTKRSSSVRNINHSMSAPDNSIIISGGDGTSQNQFPKFNVNMTNQNQLTRMQPVPLNKKKWRYSMSNLPKDFIQNLE